LDPGDEEDLVVHGQAEDDGEHDDGDERLDRGLLDVERPGEPPAFEEGLQDAQGCADRKEVHHGALEWDEQRSEDEEEEQRCHADDESDEQRKLVGDSRREVDGGGGGTTHMGLGSGAVEHVWKNVVA
jgi:hypothetical protein